MKIHSSLLVCLLFLLGTIGLSGCSNKASEEKANRVSEGIKQGYGKVIEAYEVKNGKVKMPQSIKVKAHDPYAQPGK